MAANRPMRSVANYELIEADDPRELIVLLNLAVDATAERGGSLVQSHLPDLLHWQSLDERHALYAMLEFVLPETEPAKEPLPAPLFTPTPLRVVPLTGKGENGEPTIP